MLNKSPYEELLERLDALATEWKLPTANVDPRTGTVQGFVIGQDSGYANCAEELKSLVEELSDRQR